MKTARIEIKTLPEIKKTLEKKAKDLSMNLSEFMIFSAMNSKINVSVGGHIDKIYAEIPLIDRMRKDGMITGEDYERIKDGIINKFLKTDGQ